MGGGPMKTPLWMSLSGFVMGIGIVVSGVTRPAVIHGWLDFSNRWDPTLFVFFTPAALVFHSMFRWARARQENGAGPVVQAPARRGVDLRLLAGAAVFGVGWALGGSCPGPSLASLGAGAPWAVAFVAAMFLGFRAGDFVVRLLDGETIQRAFSRNPRPG